MDKTTQGSAFDDFEPIPSTDGSYFGQKKHMEANKNHLQKKFNEAFAKSKQRLKDARVKVGLVLNSDSIQLQATLPCKPGENSPTGNKQYRLSMGIPASLDGLKTAEEEAYELGRLIARKQFDWSDKYLGKRKVEESKPKTMGELFPEFEKRYWETHKRTMKSENTFRTYKDSATSFIGIDIIFTEDSLLARFKLITTTETSKQRFLKTIRLINNILKLGIDLSGFKFGKIERRERKPPKDKQIELAFENFERYSLSRQGVKNRTDCDNWKFHRWCYGMLAAYGLRPRELFVNPDIDWWLSPDNLDNTWKVAQENKTGYREALPLHLQWVELFDLKNPECLRMLKHLLQSKIKLTSFNALIITIGKWFRLVNVGFQPYDLRHAWAIRAHMLGIPIKAAADNLGHSVDEHIKTYQRWFDLDNRKLAINAAIAKKDQMQLLKEKCERLEAENEYLKRLLTETKLNQVINNN